MRLTLYMHLLYKELPFPPGKRMESNGNGVMGWRSSKEELQLISLDRSAPGALWAAGFWQEHASNKKKN